MQLLISTINWIKTAAFQIRIPIRFFKNFERILEQSDFIHWKTYKVLATQLLQSDISDGFRILLIFTNSDRNSHWKISLLCLLYFREHIHEYFNSIFYLFVKDSHKKLRNIQILCLGLEGSVIFADHFSGSYKPFLFEIFLKIVSLTRVTWLNHTTFLPSKWNLHPKIQFLA